MHPAPSIIAFTVAAGLGYGLAFVLGLDLLDAGAVSTKVAHLAALGLISVGLLSSLLHLGNPRRAWRALSQWRSSWLSREGVMAILTFLPLVVAAWASLFEGRFLEPVAFLARMGCAFTVLATSMIYASLRSVDAWNTVWTPVCFLLFALAGGLLAANLFAAAAGGDHVLLAVFAIAATIAAWLAKIRWRMRARSLKPRSTVATATGLGHLGSVQQFEPPHMTPNYLTREMGFKVARKHADKLFTIAVCIGGLVPVLALLPVLGPAANLALPLTAIALAGHLCGVVIERWLFFAEARHSVMSFYGS